MNAIVPIKAVVLPTEADTVPTLTSQELHSRLQGGVASNLVQWGTMTKADIPALSAYLSEAKRLQIGSTEEEITFHVGRLSLHYPQPSMDDIASASRWDDWFDDFTQVPPDILAAACRDWRRSSNRFAPSPGQLLEKCLGASVRALLANRCAETIRLLEAA